MLNSGFTGLFMVILLVLGLMKMFCNQMVLMVVYLICHRPGVGRGAGVPPALRAGGDGGGAAAVLSLCVPFGRGGIGYQRWL